ncbi:MAG: GNAT family protein [Rikenellaceae bacterium]
MEGSNIVNIRKGRVTLRGVELADVDVMYGVENDLASWESSGTTQPFSHYLIESFIESQRGDIYSTRQLRLMICDEVGAVVGILDLFEFDPHNHRAGVGIFILAGSRGRGYGAEALACVGEYGRSRLQLHQLWCGVASDNEASLRLFASAGYEVSGVRREWLWRESGYCDEVMLQVLL